MPTTPDQQQITIEYTNHRHERSVRTIVPQRLYFGTTPFYREQQWLLEAFDVEKQTTRVFATANIHNWGRAKNNADPR